MQPLLAANLVIIVARPTLDGVRATAHVSKLLTESLQATTASRGEHFRCAQSAHQTIQLHGFQLPPERSQPVRLVSAGDDHHRL